MQGNVQEISELQCMCEKGLRDNVVILVIVHLLLLVNWLDLSVSPSHIWAFFFISYHLKAEVTENKNLFEGAKVFLLFNKLNLGEQKLSTAMNSDIFSTAKRLHHLLTKSLPSLATTNIPQATIQSAGDQHPLFV